MDSKLLVGNGMHMIRKYNVLPLLTAQLTIQPPSSRYYRYFHAGDVISEETTEETLAYIGSIEGNLDQGNNDTSWLD